MSYSNIIILKIQQLSILYCKLKYSILQEKEEVNGTNSDGSNEDINNEVLSYKTPVYIFLYISCETNKCLSYRLKRKMVMKSTVRIMILPTKLGKEVKR